jgi:hypothetical protein
LPRKFKLADVRDPSLSSTDTICQRLIASVSFGDAYLADQKVVLIRRGSTRQFALNHSLLKVAPLPT